MQKIAEARRMSKNIISAILLATVIACTSGQEPQQLQIPPKAPFNEFL